MTGLMLLGIALVVCACGYFIYGRWLVRLWGVDPNARTPAYVHEDGNDYVPSSKFTVHYGRRPCNRPDYCRYVRLGTGNAVADGWRHLLRCRAGFHRAVCFR